MKSHYSKTRVGVVAILFATIFAVFFVRLVFVQVINGDTYKQKALRQINESIEVPAARGEIFDACGNKVTVNTTFISLFAYPINGADISRTYDKLARILGRSRQAVKKLYPLREKKFRWIKRGLTADELARYEKQDDGRGLFLRKEPTRLYPYGDTGRSILGFVDLDNRGRSGVELVMDDQLQGAPGRSLMQKDGKGAEYQIQEIPIREAVPGQSVVLTVDWDKQQIVEGELAWAVKQFNAKGGMAVFLDPYTGAILAAVDCFADGVKSDKPMKLEAVTATIEPGSVFKLITAAAALADGSITPSDTFYAEEGRWKLGRRTLRDDHKFGWLTFRSAFEKSSNIAMGKIAYQIGGEKVFAMAHKFGFGRKTRCGLNGESKGVLKRPNRWSKFTTSTFAIGHGLSATPLQIARAFAVVASGGYLNQPYIVKGCINEEGKIIERHQSRPVRILDDEVVAILDSFLRGVVENGTGQPITDLPFPIAGKTGTAEKPNLEEGGYHKNRFMASFAGYFPVDSPRVAGIVILDEPEPIHYGGYTAGPAFRNIAVKFAAIDNYNIASVGITPEKEEKSYPTASPLEAEQVMVGDLTGVSKEEARYKLTSLGLTPAFSGDGADVFCTYPPAFASVNPGQTVRCIMARRKGSEFSVPDLLGLTLREAVAVLEEYNLSFDLSGTGRVKNQSPAGGTRITKEDIVTLKLANEEGA